MAKKISSLEGIKSIHFIGIGGSGMFPMATILYKKGYKISGSDNYESDTLEKVRKMGIKVFTEHKAGNVKGCDLVAYSAAIKESNPELVQAKNDDIPIVERSELLGIISSEYSHSIAVSGTHGKTSTTSMLTSVLKDSNKNPTSIVGGTMLGIGSNSTIGESDIFVCEACEYVNSFLHLNPRISIILNVDADHLDFFGTFENVKKSFSEFANKTKELIIVNGDDPNAVECVKSAGAKKIYYGISEKNNYYARNISFSKNQTPYFELIKDNKKIADISLSIPGKHNVYNAMAAFIACFETGVEIEDIVKFLKNFKGVHRRFEILGKFGDIVVADDFAHHPTEIKATLASAKSMGFKRVWAVFQPHTYSRTFMFLDDFAEALSIADKVVLSEILPVRETNVYNIYSEDLAEKIDGSVCFKTFEEITDYIANKAKEGDLVLTMGGGNVYKCANMIRDRLAEIY